MLKIYGNMQCPDCVRCRKELDAAKVEYVYLDFSDSLRNLKEFLILREQDPQFREVKEKGGIGILCIVREDGSITFVWEEYM